MQGSGSRVSGVFGFRASGLSFRVQGSSCLALNARGNRVSGDARLEV